MRCRRCGHDNEHGANYCSSCGAPLEVDEDTTAALALIEDRQSLAAELGDLLDELPEGLGMLVVRRGPNAGSTFALQQDETSLGRHPDSDVFLDDVTVSRRHAVVGRTESGYEVTDAGSLNGTYVDHVRVETAKLHDMSELQVGRFVLTFVIGGRDDAGPWIGLVSVEANESAGPHLSIGEVLEHLRGEFPDVTISKIRFLESQGLIDPERTPSGYRKFSEDDLERLRWILGQQRDHFLPLRIIRERLDAFGPAGAPPYDATVDDRLNGATEPEGAAPRLPFEDAVDADGTDDDGGDELGPITPDDAHPTGELSRAELLETVGITDAQLDALEDHGLVTPLIGEGERALYDEEALTVAGIAAGFHARGIEARHLKMYGHFADREAALFGQVLIPYLRQRNPMARERLQEELEELARLGRRLRTEMLRRALRDELTE